MQVLQRVFLFFVFFGFHQFAFANVEYFPDRFKWQTISPEQAGFDAQKLRAAISLAEKNTVLEPNDIHQHLLDTYTPKEPDYRVLGPTAPRVVGSGMILKNGKIVGQWGDTQKVDMTFSVVKSYLSTLVAIALRDGLINDVHDPVKNYVADGKFDSPKNAQITWHHLLQQTSDWQGSLWDIPDWADRPVGDTLEEWRNRTLYPAGTHFKYNDVRINLLAYSLLQVFRRPLPEVLKLEIMDKIGASNTWRWHGYHNSWVELDGQKMQSVSGGGHFGGGLFINTEDHARFGLLFLRKGIIGNDSLLPETWIKEMRVPSEHRKDYGYLWWLNSQQRVKKAPQRAYWAAGFGGNYIFIDDQNDLVVVLRWIPEWEEVVNAIYQAMNQ